MNFDVTGMDIAQIRNMVRVLDRKADEVNRLIDSMTAEVDRTTWIGRDRDRFAGEWRERHAPALRRVAENLESASAQARDYAQRQERASRGGGGGRGW